MMQHTSKVSKYLQKMFCITKCLTSNAATIIQIKIKYCAMWSCEVKRVVYGQGGDFTLYYLKIGKT